MDKIAESIKCTNCRSILAAPVSLPCGHLICHKHTNIPEDVISCNECGESHTNRGFVVIKALSNMIDANIGSIDFGEEHREAREYCEKFKKELDAAETVLTDPVNLIYETVASLKNKVYLKTEELKRLIDESAQKLLSHLDDYQKRCCENLETLNFVNIKTNFKSSIDESRKDLNTWRTDLNQLKYNYDKFLDIKDDCDRKIDEINKIHKEFNKRVLMYQESNQKLNVESFCNMNFRLELKKWTDSFRAESSLELLKFDSKILDLTEQTKLLSLCKMNSNQLSLELLYRASENGFGAKDFHKYCDNISQTLTIIKSKCGNVFGGYTSKTWNETENDSESCENEEPLPFVQDPDAFLFSLVNKHDYPACVRVMPECFSICRDPTSGPIFGEKNEIMICNRADVNLCYSKVGFSYGFPDQFLVNNQSLALNNEFFVSDLEVFQVVSN